MKFIEKNINLNLNEVYQYILGFDNFKNTGEKYLLSFVNAEKYHYTLHKFYTFLTQFFDKNKNIFLNNSLSVSKYLKVLSFIKKHTSDFNITAEQNKIRLENYIAEANKLTSLYNSINKYGYLYNEKDPIILLQLKNEYFLIDGFHRFFVCKYLQIEQLKVKVIHYEQ